ncbi:hypothetical protein Tco_0459728 [Tanacetum coccineum]
MELEDLVLVYIPEPEHPEDLVPVEDEVPIEPYITEVASAPTPPLPPPSLLPILIRPPHTRAAMAQKRATTPSIYHSLLPAGMPPLLPILVDGASCSIEVDTGESAKTTTLTVMSSDSAVTYTSVHSEARSWSIPSEDPYEEAARQLLEQAPRPSECVPDPMELEDHVPMYTWLGLRPTTGH